MKGRQAGEQLCFDSGLLTFLRFRPVLVSVPISGATTPSGLPGCLGEGKTKVSGQEGSRPDCRSGAPVGSRDVGAALLLLQ